METKELKQILEDNISIVEYYGSKKQIPIWIEEMSELTKVLCKWIRFYDQLDGNINNKLLENLKEEITDVTICLDQLRYVIQFNEYDLMQEYKKKVDRQLGRIENEVN